MVMDKTLYDRLEVETDASIEEIKKSGKKLMVKWHPDKHPKNVEVATKKFQEVQEALSILENPEKRQMYDEYGMNFLKGDMPQQNPFPGGFPFGGGGFPFSDMFGGQFSGFGQGGGREKQDNIMERLTVTLEQIYKEETVELKYKHQVYCVKCSGEGTNDGTVSECKDCNGKGMRVQVTRMGPMVQQTMVPCNGCRGKGRKVPDKNKCDSCNGQGMTEKEKTVPVPLKSGLTTGVKLQLEGKGHHYKNTKTDLIIIIQEQPHPVFKRTDSDLFVEIELKLYQALFGFDKMLTHLDGRKLHLHHTGKTDFGTMRRISGEGMKDLRSGMKGDLVIKFNVNLPDITNDTLIKALTLIDKVESQNEKNMLKETDLVKTIMLDMKSYKEHKEAHEPDSDEEGHQHHQQAQCAQQ